MRSALALLLVLAAAAGCGGSDEADDDEHVAPTGPVAVDTCLGERGYSLLPAANGVSAVTPGGVEFTIAFFDSAEQATSAADSAGGRATAVDNAVVTSSGKALSRAELDEIEDCVGRASGG